jgi:hypothetical protein
MPDLGRRVWERRVKHEVPGAFDHKAFQPRMVQFLEPPERLGALTGGSTNCSKALGQVPGTGA